MKGIVGLTLHIPERCPLSLTRKKNLLFLLKSLLLCSSTTTVAVGPTDRQYKVFTYLFWLLLGYGQVQSGPSGSSAILL